MSRGQILTAEPANMHSGRRNGRKVADKKCVNFQKIREKTENKKTLKNFKKPLAIPKNYAIISLACEGNENKETKQVTIK